MRRTLGPLFVFVVMTPAWALAACPDGMRSSYRHDSRLGGQVEVCNRISEGWNLWPLAVVAAAVVLSVGGSRFFAAGRTVGGDYRPGGSGLPEQIFFWIFGAPRDAAKEANLSWTKRPSPPPRRGFQGRGATRRW